MYTSLAELWEGWTKNMFLGLQDRLWLLFFGGFVALLGALVLPAWLLAGLAWLSQGGGAAAAVVIGGRDAVGGGAVRPGAGGRGSGHFALVCAEPATGGAVVWDHDARIEPCGCCRARGGLEGPHLPVKAGPPGAGAIIYSRPVAAWKLVD